MSVIFEAAILQLIYFSDIEVLDARNLQRLKLKGMMFSKKLNKLNEVLQKYHPDLLIKYEKLLLELSEFKEIRNQLGHCQIDFIDENLKYINIWDVAESEDNYQYYTPIKYSIEDLRDKLMKYLNTIIPPLVQLQNEVEQCLQNSNPNVYALLVSERNAPKAI